MCLAPCFKGCTDQEYAHEVGRVQAYFDSGGDSLVREIFAQRDQASTDLHFEDAAALHAKLDKSKPLIAQLPEAVHRIDQLGGNHGAAKRPTAVGRFLPHQRRARLSGAGEFPHSIL